MTGQEQAVNESLCALDEAHRLGHITRDEYRARRRYVIGRLSDSSGETARKAITMQTGGGSAATRRAIDGGGTPATDSEALRLMFSPRSRAPWWYAVGALVLVVLAGLVLYVFLHGS